MKKAMTIAAILMIAVALVGCGGGSGNNSGSSRSSAPAVSDEDAKLAFVVSFVSVFTGSMAAAFGQEMPGITLDEETNVLTLDKFSLNDLNDDDTETEIPYSSVSGTASSGEDDQMMVDVTMEGGPVESISYTIGSAEMQSEAGFSITVVANGNEMVLEMNPEDFQ